ncbi:MAG: glycosyltransferase family 4 protein [Solirubrobacteraceae bacterium]
MHVGLNLIFLAPGDTGGMEVAARELLPALVAAAPRHRFTAFVNRDAGSGPWTELMPSVVVPVSIARRSEWVRGEQQLLPRLAQKAGVELMHSLASTGPAHGRFRRVVTVHDLIYRRFPEAHAGVRSLGMRVLVPLAVRSSHRVIADSQSTRHDLIELLGTPPEKVDVVPLGIGAPRRAQPAAPVNLGGDRPILLTLSAKRPHKNLAALIDAVAQIPQERRPQLVLPGYPTPHEQELRARAAQSGVDASFPAWLSEAEIEGLWDAAAAFVYPSLYEGFGLPVLEAMQRRVPVACSNAASLPEVAGDAALTFDPRDTAAMTRAIERVLGDPPLRERLVRAGAKRAAQFSWERCARETLEVYRRA